jgi:hypothetical protein
MGNNIMQGQRKRHFTTEEAKRRKEKLSHEKTANIEST